MIVGRRVVVFLLLSGWLGWCPVRASVAEMFFEREVRPIFVEHCQKCHGANKQKGGLRLDSFAGLLEGGSLGPALVPGSVDQSLFIRAVRRLDEDLKMPPDDPLTPAQVRRLEIWVRGGAQWPERKIALSPSPDFPDLKRRHWAFQPVRRPDLPRVRNTAWPINPIDHFVLARLEAEGLAPSGQADRRTLIRRAYLNLVGLPPTDEAIQSFVSDPSPRAFERVVDGLLARREYGERWERHWLDVARYADAKGYVDAGEVRYPFAYTYRDYVVRAFNEDLPFDRFILEQLAADRLTESGDLGSLAALGFLTVGSRYNFFPHEIVDDRIDAVTRGFLGLSVGCARCHDHKYDPIPTEDYYTLYGIFASSREPSPDRWPRLSSMGRAEDDEFQEKLRETAGDYRELRAELLRRIQHELRAWCGDYLRYIVQSTPEHRTTSQPELRTKRGLIREVSAYSGGAVIRWRAFLASRDWDDPVFGLWRRLFDMPREAISDGFPAVLKAWRESGVANQMVLTAFEGMAPQSMADVADIYGALLEGTEGHWQDWLELGGPPGGFLDPNLEQLRQVLYGPEAPAMVTVDESEDLYTLDESVKVRSHFANIERVFLEKWDGVAPRPMLMVDRPRPVEQRVFVRGDSKRPGPRVERRIPALLAGGKARPIEGGSGRLALASAITNPDNPLTARVIVNRAWAWHFGQGLVETPSDFGLRSSPPTHPELLDYLSSWFVEQGWSLKQLHRMILSSMIWQQTSVDREEGRSIDPVNRLLWRMNRRRLDFEAMRDSMLAVSGLLEPFQGGPPVQKRPDDVSHRKRTLYSYVDREKLAELYRVFDFPSPDITAPKRSRTTVPQQSHFLLNSPFVIAQAEAVVRRLGLVEVGPLMEDRPTIAGSIVRLYRQIYGRRPEVDELGLAQDYLLSRARSLTDPSVDGTEENAWAELAQTLLLSNEFLFVE